MKRTTSLALLVAAAGMTGLSGCQVVPAVQEMMGPPLTCEQVADFTQQGEASWYGRFHHGRPTASGEPFDVNKLTAAHRRLPLGSRVRVKNLENGREATLVVNDRGPFTRGRILDVSQRGAQELDFQDDGTATVKIEVESCGKQRRAPTEETTAGS